MKKILLFFALISLTYVINAQTGCPNCVTDQSFITSDGMPGINLTTLPNGCLNQPYQQDATLYLPGNFTYQGTSMQLRNVQLVSCTGMPPGLNWEKNGGGTTWTVNGTTTRGCFRLCGTPTSAGVFNVTININATVRLYGFLDQTQSQSSVIAMTILTIPTPADVITGTSAVCLGQTAVSYSTAPITDATSYIWEYSGTGAIINGTTNNVTIDFSASFTPGNLSVKGTNSCGVGVVSANYPISIIPNPDNAGIIIGTDTVCQAQSAVSYSVPLINNADAYTWSYSGVGATINGSTESITIDFAANATSGDLTVSGNNSCGNGIISANYPIIVNQFPDSAREITGSDAVCQGQTLVSYSTSIINNADSYTWSYSGLGATINGSTESITIDFAPNATSGDLTVFGNNSCGNGIISANYPIIVNLLPDSARELTGSDTVCQGQTLVSYSTSLINNADSYTWSYSGLGATINGSTESITIDFAANATTGNLIVNGYNSCGDGVSSSTYLINVNPLPESAGIIIGSDSVCLGQIGVIYSLPVIAYADSIIWSYSGTGANINGSQNSTTFDFDDNATSGDITVIGHNVCGNGVSSIFNVIVRDCNEDINENSANSHLDIIPNPNNGVFALQINSSSNQICEIFITNSIGQIVKRDVLALSLGINSFITDLSTFSNGIYYSRISTSNNTIVRKFIINR